MAPVGACNRSRRRGAPSRERHREVVLVLRAPQLAPLGTLLRRSALRLLFLETSLRRDTLRLLFSETSIQCPTLRLQQDANAAWQKTRHGR